MKFFFLFFAAVVAFALSTVSGGGAGLLLLPILATVLPGMAVPAALTIGTASSTVSKLWLFRQSIRWDITKWFVPGAIPGVLLGVLLLGYLNPIYFELLIGLFLIAHLPMLFRHSTDEREGTLTGQSWRLLVIGFFAGFLSGLTGAVGLLFNKFYFRHGLKRNEVIATRAANELLIHVIKLGLYLSFGLLTSTVWQAGVIVALGAVLATTVTKRYLHLLSEVVFRRIGYAAMVLSGGFMLSSAGRSIQQSQNLGARLKFFDNGDREISGWWTGGSVSIEWEYDDGLAIENEVDFSDLPSTVQHAVLAHQAKRPIIKIEEVWQWNKRYYEIYCSDNGRVVKLEFAA